MSTHSRDHAAKHDVAAEDDIHAYVDHGGIQGLADDDHSQYHNNTRGDARYYQQSELGSTTGGSEGSSLIGTNSKTNLGASTDVEGCLDALDTHVGDTTKHFTEASIDHGSIAGLADDDHSQYHNDTRGDARYLKLAGGTMAGAIAMGTNKITGMGDPTNAQDGATKSYVDGLSQGLDWQDSVLDKDLTAAPGAPTTGDRYITGRTLGGAVVGGGLGGAGVNYFELSGDQSGKFSAADIFKCEASTSNDGYYTVVSAIFTTVTTIIVQETIPSSTWDGNLVIVGATGGTTWNQIGPEKIVDYDGATWDVTIPNEGMATWVEDEDNLYVYNNAAGLGTWVIFGSTQDHGALGGLADDDHTQYHNDTRGDARYYLQSAFYDTNQSSAVPVKTVAGGNIDSSFITELDQTAKGAGDPGAGMAEGDTKIWYVSSAVAWLIFKTDTTALYVEMTG